MKSKIFYKERKKLKKGELQSIYGTKKVDGKRVFVCGEGLCEYYSSVARDVKTHKANIHDIDATYYYCDQKGCESCEYC